jgi:hypothetical protein
MRIHFSIFKVHRCIKVNLSQRLMYPTSNLSVKEGSKSGFPENINITRYVLGGSRNRPLGRDKRLL